jgi:hypothetical protein
MGSSVLVDEAQIIQGGEEGWVREPIQGFKQREVDQGFRQALRGIMKLGSKFGTFWKLPSFIRIPIYSCWFFISW